MIMWLCYSVLLLYLGGLTEPHTNIVDHGSIPLSLIPCAYVSCLCLNSDSFVGSGEEENQEGLNLEAEFLL